MGIFNRLFSSSDAASKGKQKLEWVPLNSIAQLDEIQSLSAGNKVLIFKHSTRCGISSMVLKKFEAALEPQPDTVLYILDLLNHRDISNEIANRFHVHHESPQLIVIENGSCTHHASHYKIVEWASSNSVD